MSAADLPFVCPWASRSGSFRRPPACARGRIESVRPGPKGPLVKICGVDDVDAAQALRRRRHAARRAMTCPTTGARTVDEGADPVGLTVTDVRARASRRGRRDSSSPAPTTCGSIEGPLGEVLLPVIDDVVLEIDWEAERVNVALLPGLMPGRGGDRVIVDVITIFPGMFEGPMSASIVGLARERGLLELRCHDLRDWTHDKHRTTDDDPYGGGPGMVMKPEPIFEAVDAVQALEDEPGYVIFFTPGGVALHPGACRSSSPTRSDSCWCAVATRASTSARFRWPTSSSRSATTC